MLKKCSVVIMPGHIHIIIHSTDKILSHVSFNLWSCLTVAGVMSAIFSDSRYSSGSNGLLKKTYSIDKGNTANIKER